MVAAAIILHDVTVRKRGRAVLDGISASIPTAGCTVVMGPNGAGKTSFLRTLHGMERLRSGTVEWQQPKEHTLHRQSLMFQTPVMLRRSVRANLRYPLAVQGRNGDAVDDAVARWAAHVGLADRLNEDARRLSGGEQQKLALARALIAEPDILLLDEPTTNLDGSATRDIETLLKVAIAGGTKIIMATHDLGQAKRLADHVMFLHHGQLLESGAGADFFERPKTRQATAFLRGDIVE